MSEASKDRPTRRSWTPELALVVSVLSLLVSTLAIYFSSFAAPEDLTVAIRPQGLEQISTDTLNVTFVFTNLGKQAVAIERVVLIQIHKAASGVEDGERWQKIIPLAIDGFQPLTRLEDVIEGGVMTYRNATSAVFNNDEIKSTSLLVEPKSVAVLTATFNPRPVDILKEGALSHNFAIRFFDKKGVPHMHIVRAWRLNADIYKQNERGEMEPTGKIYSPSPNGTTTQLLPIK
jgi:hypothetical protein